MKKDGVYVNESSPKIHFAKEAQSDDEKERELSPTKWMINMKNAQLKNQLENQEEWNDPNKILYTVGPNQSYQIEKEIGLDIQEEAIQRLKNELTQDIESSIREKLA